MRRARNLVKTLTATAAFSIVSATSCAESSVVLDKANGKPIPGAIVVATWNGVVGVAVQGASQCFKAEVAITNDHGQFDVSSFSWNLSPFLLHRQRGFEVLAHGYQTAKEWNPQELPILMEPQTGSSSERFQRLPSTSAIGCPEGDRVILPYLKALYKEMASLSTTKLERLAASRILSEIELIELGDAEASRRSSRRRNEIEKDAR